MTDSEPGPGIPPARDDDAPPGWIARGIGHIALRASRWPGRRWVGLTRRRASRRAGGRPFRVRGRDGVCLAGWYSPAGDRELARARLPVVVLHGWLETKEFHFPRAWQLNRAGHDVILMDHRAHGRSSGSHTTFGVRERHDLRALLDGADKRNLTAGRFLVLGYSMGGAVALQHAPEDERVEGVIALAPYAELRDAVCSFRLLLAPSLNEPWLLAGFERAMAGAGFHFTQASTLKAVQRMRVPLLLIEAGQDRNLPPPAHVRRIAEHKAHGPLETLSLDRATHCSLTRRPWPELDQAIMRFCRQPRPE